MKKIKIRIIEVWKKIIIENIITDYSVLNKGRIRNDLTNKILKPCSDGKYLQIAIFINKKKKNDKNS